MKRDISWKKSTVTDKNENWCDQQQGRGLVGWGQATISQCTRLFPSFSCFDLRFLCYFLIDSSRPYHFPFFKFLSVVLNSIIFSFFEAWQIFCFVSKPFSFLIHCPYYIYCNIFRERNKNDKFNYFLKIRSKNSSANEWGWKEGIQTCSDERWKQRSKEKKKVKKKRSARVKASH